VAAIAGDDSDRFPVIASQDSSDGSPIVSIKTHPVADAEFEHRLVRVQLPYQPKTLDDPTIESTSSGSVKWSTRSIRVHRERLYGFGFRTLESCGHKAGLSFECSDSRRVRISSITD
jgi:hypothetical protein